MALVSVRAFGLRSLLLFPLSLSFVSSPRCCLFAGYILVRSWMVSLPSLLPCLVVVLAARFDWLYVFKGTGVQGFRFHPTPTPVYHGQTPDSCYISQ